MQKCSTLNFHTEKFQARKVRLDSEPFYRNPFNVSKDVDIDNTMKNAHFNNMSSKKNKNYSNCTNPKIKKYTTAYGLFFREYYTQLKLSYPSSRFGEMSRLIASKWRRLDKSERKFYKSQVHKRAYSTNYGLYFHEEYTEIKASDPNATFGEISTKISRMWDCLSLKEKNSYRPKREKVMPHLSKLDLQNSIQINNIANSRNIKDNQNQNKLHVKDTNSLALMNVEPWQQNTI